jgi:hypothetical protein
MNRPNYFTGRVLTADDLQAEQEYHRGMRRRHNLFCHGFGVVQGLKVSTAKDDAGWTVTVAPGFALDFEGNELQLCAQAKLRAPELRTPVEVCIRFVERPTDPVPVFWADGIECSQPSRIEESCEVFLNSKPQPASSAANSKGRGCFSHALPLARLVRTRRGWQVDREFKSRRGH